MSNTIRLSWGVSSGAVSYNIYHAIQPGLSVALTPLLANTTNLTYDHTGVNTLTPHYYIIAAVGPNGEISPPTSEILVQVVLVSIAVTPSNMTLIVGNTQQYTATGTYSDSSTADITGSVTWTSSNTNFVTISVGGLASGIAAGTTTITATLGAISGNTNATVNASLFTVLYDKIVNKPGSPPTGYSHAAISPYSSGFAKMGSTLVAANPANAFFTSSGTNSGDYPFLTSTDNGATWAFTSWAQASDSNMSLDGGSFYSSNIWATTDKFLGGCNGNQLTNVVESSDGITWATGIHAGTNIKSIAAFHGTSNANIWGVCDGPTTGTVVVFNSTDDGATWTQAATLTSGGSSYFPSVFSISSTDVWIAGFTNGVNTAACVYHYNGSTWTDCSAALRTAKGGPFNSGITGIYASGTNDVYFIDAGGINTLGHNQLYHTSDQGTTFTVVDVDPANSVVFNGIGGNSANDIYLAGYAGNVYHSTNGTTWTKQTLPNSPAYIATDDYLHVYCSGGTTYITGPNIIKK